MTTATTANDDTTRNNVLLDIFASSKPLEDVVRNHGITIEQLCDWCEAPDVQERAQRLLNLCALRTKLRLAQFRLDAIETLNRLARGDTEITESQRKSAAQLLRTRDHHLDPEPMTQTTTTTTATATATSTNDDTPSPQSPTTTDHQPPTPLARIQQQRNARTRNQRTRYKKRKSA